MYNVQLGLGGSFLGEIFNGLEGDIGVIASLVDDVARFALHYNFYFYFKQTINSFSPQSSILTLMMPRYKPSLLALLHLLHLHVLLELQHVDWVTARQQSTCSRVRKSQSLSIRSALLLLHILTELLGNSSDLLH